MIKAEYKHHMLESIAMIQPSCSRWQYMPLEWLCPNILTIFLSIFLDLNFTIDTVHKSCAHILNLNIFNASKDNLCASMHDYSHYTQKACLVKYSYAISLIFYIPLAKQWLHVANFWLDSGIILHEGLSLSKLSKVTWLGQIMFYLTHICND